MRLYQAQQVLALFLRLFAQLCPKAQRRIVCALLNVLFQAIERAAADEQDIFGVNLDKFLLRMLAPAVGRHVADRALQNF